MLKKLLYLASGMCLGILASGNAEILPYTIFCIIVTISVDILTDDKDFK